MNLPAAHWLREAELLLRVEAAIERLINLLDELDGDPDTEPSLGWSSTMAIGTANDRELDAVAA